MFLVLKLTRKLGKRLHCIDKKYTLYNILAAINCDLADR